MFRKEPAISSTGEQEVFDQFKQRVSQCVTDILEKPLQKEKLDEFVRKNYENRPLPVAILNYLLENGALEYKEAYTDPDYSSKIGKRKESGEIITESESIATHFWGFYRKTMDPTILPTETLPHLKELYIVLKSTLGSEILSDYAIKSWRDLQSLVFESVNLLNAASGQEIPSGPISQQE